MRERGGAIKKIFHFNLCFLKIQGKLYYLDHQTYINI